MPRDEVSRTVNIERNGGHKWVKMNKHFIKTRKISQNKNQVTAQILCIASGWLEIMIATIIIANKF